MLDVLEHLMRYPGIWHSIGNDKTYRRAIEVLLERGVIETNTVTDQYRLVR